MNGVRRHEPPKGQSSIVKMPWLNRRSNKRVYCRSIFPCTLGKRIVLEGSVAFALFDALVSSERFLSIIRSYAADDMF